MNYDLTSPTKTASVRFKPGGIYHGLVARVDGAKAWVMIPRFSTSFTFGPVAVAAPSMPSVGDRVACGFVEDRADDIVVLGVFKKTSDLNLSGMPLPIGLTAAEGSLPTGARSDHVHVLGADVVDASTIELSAGVLRVKDGGVSAAKLAAGVAGAGLGHDPVNGLSVTAGTGLEVSADTVRIAAAAAGDGLTGGGGTALAVNPGAGLEISGDAVRIAASAAGDGLTGGGGSALAVNPGTGLEISADTVRIAAAAAGDGLTGGGGSALAVNVDDSTIEIVGDSVRVKDGGITAAKLSAELSGSVTPSGAIVAFGGSSAPSGWLLCDGTNVSRSTYSALFAAIGTAFGAGDGTTTFGLPNLAGRVPVGRDAAQTEFDVLGESGGAKTHTLTMSEMPAHTHGDGTLAAASAGAHTHDYTAISGLTGYGQSSPINGNAIVGTTTAATSSNGAHTHDVTGATGSTGSGAAHNNLQPYLVINYIIKT